MKRVLKWAGYGLGGVVVFVLFVVAGAFTASEVVIRWPVQTTDVKLTAANAASVERGARVAKLNGCTDCHGDKLEGKLFHDEPKLMRAWGPNLSLLAAEQTDAELDRAIRHGVAADGRPLWIMPSYAFSQLTDQETADLIAWLRTAPKTGEEQPRMQLGPLMRVGVITGMLKSEPAMVNAKGPIQLPDYGPQHQSGRTLARLCVECHGADLKGNKMLQSPDLTVAAAYDRDAFGRLMHDGVGAAGQPLGLMTGVSISRFRALDAAEVTALHDYLKVRAETEIAAAQ